MNIDHQPIKLFLYGSLLTGTPDRRLNRQIKRLLRRSPTAVIQARLYNLGRYPGIIPSTAVTKLVYGRLVSVKDPRLLRSLDRYEESAGIKGEFVRTQLAAQLLPSRKQIDCWVYVYNRSIEGKQRIVGGDYVRYRKHRKKWPNSTS